MELKEYIRPLRKWWWLILATTIVSTVSAYIGTTFQQPVYRAHTALMIGQAIEDPNPTGTDFFLGQQLALTYADIAKRRPVRQATMDVLGLTWLPDYTVSVLPNNQLLEIAVTDTSPERAQAVANVLAQELIQQSPTSNQQEDQQRQAFISQQLDSLEAKITETEDEVAELQESIADMISARQIADTEGQIAVLQSKLATLQTNYATLVDNTRKGALNTLNMVEPADRPAQPVGPDKFMTILLGAAIGLVLSSGAAYLMEYLDDSLKSPEEIAAVFQLPLIGFIVEDADHGDDDDEGQSVVVTEKPRAPISEAYRTLRTNLEFASVDAPLNTILITSPSPADGKSTVAANLAVMIALAGRKVTLLDADLRRPRVHRFLNLSNRAGLSDLFRGHMELGDVLQSVDGIDNLSVITSGKLPPDPAELLGSSRMEQILVDLRALADVVIIDSPPFLVSDAAVLASRVDGVLLVLQPGRTTAATARAMLEQLERADARMVGVVLNRIPRAGSGYYSGYQYYYAPYYYRSHYYLDADYSNGHKKRGDESNGWLSRLRRDRPDSQPSETRDET